MFYLSGFSTLVSGFSVRLAVLILTFTFDKKQFGVISFGFISSLLCRGRLLLILTLRRNIIRAFETQNR